MKILFISLGCDKNLVDTEVMLGMLASRGYEMTNDEQEANIIVINTCCFIHDAKEESINTILQLSELKKRKKTEKLFVMGCLSERYQKELEAEIPEVDKFYGKFNYTNILFGLGHD
jgi:ribosomal protein S12 methylthiotransferase